MFTGIGVEMAFMRIVFVLSCLLLMAPVVSAQEADVIEEEWADTAPRPRDAALFRSEMMHDHNDLRRRYGIAPLAWDDALAADARTYARTLAAKHVFEHAPRLPGRPVQGENLWMGTLSAYSYRDMTGSWIEEGTDFAPGRFPAVSRTGSWHDVGHYTQMIWAGTHAFGCGLAANRNNEYLVCRYYPAGNVWGESALGR
jgi:Cysteine-rich secretory protein family